MTILARAPFALLVVATFAAFFVAQRLKSEPSVINSFDVVKYFSPVCQCNRAEQKVRFELAEADDVTVDVVDDRGDRVARLGTALPAKPFNPVRVTWRGRTDEGARAPDGTYRIRIGLRRQARSVVAPFAFSLDTKAPTPAVKLPDSQPPIVAPGQPVRFRVGGAGRRAQPEMAVLRTDDGEPEVVRRFKLGRGERSGTWDGLGDDGRPVALGTYVLQAAVADRAGNVGKGPPLPLVPARVEGSPGVIVRGLAVQMPVKPLTAGQLVSFRVDPRGNAYRWSIRRVGSPPRKKSPGRKTNTTIVTRAPRGASGAYLLELRAGRYSAQIPFAVQSADPAPLLVVLPVIRWLGTNQLDAADRDGIPNTFATGSDVPYPRAFAGEDGLPQGFADEVAPLLALLDRARLRYDITTDLELSLGREPRAGDRPGVLFAGSSRWVTRSLARRLRRYVTDGGRLALFGTGALRAGVRIDDQRLTGATPSSPNDALGGRVSAPREVKTELAQLRDEPTELKIFEGWGSAVLGGFGRVEELVTPGQGNEVVAGIGELVTEEEVRQTEAEGRELREERPAFSVVKQGKGYVFRVGIEGWVKRIAEGDADVVQITRNVADLLRRVTPRVRSGGR